MTSEERKQAMVVRDYQAILDNYDPYATGFNEPQRCNRIRSYMQATLRAGYTTLAIRLAAEAINLDRWSTDSDYCELAAAHWLEASRLKGDTEKTVTDLRRALKCQYGDSAQNMTPALLLYYVAVRTQDKALKQEAITQIEKKLKTGWSRNWPAPLGRYLTEVEGEEHVELKLKDQHPIREPNARCRFEFYKGVKLLEAGNEAGAMKCFRTAVDIPDQKTDTTEFVLARHELGETPIPPKAEESPFRKVDP